MQYMIAFYEPDSEFKARDGEGSAEFWPAWQAYFQAMREAAVNIAGAPLKAPQTGVTVRNGAEGRTVHDGPYADTKEQLGGFVIVEVPSLDEALGWARRAPCAATGAVEVRPVLPAAAEAGLCETSVQADGLNYALSIYESAVDFAAREGAGAERYWAGWSAFSKALEDGGVVKAGTALRGPETATVVRMGKDGLVVHDGPYADTKEQLGGVLLVKVDGHEDALQWAARCPATLRGAVEVRPVLPVAARV